MSFTIITDSTVDISPSRTRELDVTIIPLTVSFDGKEYRDGLDLSPERFFAKLAEAKKLPTTSQVTVGAFVDAFEGVPAEQDIICICLSQKLSGTYQSATIAKEQLGRDNIYLVDTGSGSFGSQVLLRIALEQRQKGADAEETARLLQEAAPRLRLFAVVDTLKYLHKGGRLPHAVAVVGGLLQVKPVLEVRHGEISMAGKARGSGAALDIVCKLVNEQSVDNSYPVVIGSAQCPQRLKEFSDTLGKHCQIQDPAFCDIGVVIGTHTGPGCVGVAFIAKT
ncbi:MAG: DegV family protein [Angelakisella sp.]|nr:DegV family protein [Angelakisella sp.]